MSTAAFRNTTHFSEIVAESILALTESIAAVVSHPTVVFLESVWSPHQCIADDSRCCSEPVKPRWPVPDSGAAQACGIIALVVGIDNDKMWIIRS